LTFKGKREIGIMQIYLPPQTNDERDRTIRKATTTLTNWRNKQMGIIVMGDMNTTCKDDIDRTGMKEPKKKKAWIEAMKKAELYDTYRQHNGSKEEYTWEGETKSRIDMIWISKDMKELCKTAAIQDERKELNTDHKVVKIQIDLEGITKNIIKMRTSRQRTIYDYTQMDENKWKK
jgi:exonuclease III